MVLKIVLYIVFVIAVVLWVAVTAKLTTLGVKSLALGQPLRNAIYVQIAILSGWIGIFLFTWIVSGSLDITLLIVFLAAAELAFVLGLGVRAVFGQTRTASFFGAGIEIGLTRPRVIILNQAIALLMILAYLVGMGILLFSAERSTLAEPSFRLGMLLLFLLPFGARVLGTMVLASPALDQDSRERQVVSDLIGLLPELLTLSVLLASVTTTGTLVNIPGVGDVIPVNLLAAGVLIALFLGRTLVPYLIGTNAHKRLGVSFTDERTTFLEAAVVMLERPTAEIYEDELTKLKEQARQRFETIVEEHPVLELGEEAAFALQQGDPEAQMIDEGSTLQLTSDAREQLSALDRSSPADQDIDAEDRLWREFEADDIRFRQLEWLREFSAELDAALTNLENRRSPRAKEQAAGEWARSFANKRDRVIAKEQSGAVQKPRALALLISLLGLIATAVFSQVGEWLWNAFASQLGG